MQIRTSHMTIVAGAILGAVVALGASAQMDRKTNTNQPAMHQYEPPDPCMAATAAHGSGGGAGKITMRKAGGEQMEMRKAGGEQMGAMRNNNVHCLNPQPLPPG